MIACARRKAAAAAALGCRSPARPCGTARRPGGARSRSTARGAANARPTRRRTYTLVERKHTGVNLGMTVVDPQGREWSVKQPYPGGLDNEAPVEVALSRLLSAVGYHQPPVYHLPDLHAERRLGHARRNRRAFQAEGRDARRMGVVAVGGQPVHRHASRIRDCSCC